MNKIAPKLNSKGSRGMGSFSSLLSLFLSSFLLLSLTSMAANITVNITNFSQSEVLELNQSLELNISVAPRVVRGDLIEIKATAIGEAKNLVLKWILPEGFEIVNGSLEKSCGDLQGACEAKIFVKVSKQSKLGLNLVEVRAVYE